MITYNSTARGGSGSRASLFRSCATAAIGLGFATSTLAAPVALTTQAAKLQYLQTHMLKASQTANWRPMFLSGRPNANKSAFRNQIQAAGAGLTVPYWTTTITSPLDHQTYNVSMVGSSPYVATPANTRVKYLPVAIRIHLGGFVLDPSAPSNCDTQSPARRFFNSPVFRPTSFTSNGVNVSNVPGGTQLISAFQRANFWQSVQGTNYGVTLTPSRLDTLVVDWYPSDPQDFVAGVNDNCGGVTPVAIVNINEFDNELRAIASTYAHSDVVPISLGDDVAIYIGGNTNNCCVLGYHNAISVPGGTQVYSVGAYFDTNQVFGGRFPDVTVWVHELGELIDDPFVQSIPGIPGGGSSDLTPAWGHTGQVGGCQGNLETGDPLTPAQLGNFGVFPITGVGGFVYHYQDLAFHDWFYRTASTSTGGKYSFAGYLTSVQPACN